MQNITNNAAYFRLTEPQRKLYRSGLPLTMFGQSIRKMNFQAHSTGTGLKKSLISATKQMQTLIDVCNKINVNVDISAVWLLHSAANDNAAFAAAAAVYEALFPLFGGRVLGVDELYENHKPQDVYLIHGVSPEMRDGDVAGLRSFVRKHSGSLVLVVASASSHDPSPSAVDDLVHRKLRIHVNKVFTLVGDVAEIVVPRTRIMEA